MLFRSIRSRIAVAFLGVLGATLLLLAIVLAQFGILNAPISRWLLSIGIGAAFVMYLMAALIARRTTLPIERLTKAARSMADGDLSQRIYPQTKDEMEGLT